MAYRPGCPVHVRKDPHRPDLDVNHAAAVHAILTHPALAALQAGPCRDAWTLEAMHRRSTIALVCQHGRRLDALPSALAYDHRHRARVGTILAVRLLTADDPLYPSRLVAVLG